MGEGGGGRKIFFLKNPGPNFPDKISSSGKVLLYALHYLQAKRQDRIADEKNIQARKHLPARPPPPDKNQMVAPLRRNETLDFP